MLAFLSVVYRELSPYKNPSTNMLSMATNYQIAFTYTCALLLDGGLLDEYNGGESMSLGTLLLIVNVLVLILLSFGPQESLSLLGHHPPPARAEQAADLPSKRRVVSGPDSSGSGHNLPRILRAFIPVCEVEQISKGNLKFYLLQASDFYAGFASSPPPPARPPAPAHW